MQERLFSKSISKSDLSENQAQKQAQSAYDEALKNKEEADAGLYAAMRQCEQAKVILEEIKKKIASCVEAQEKWKQARQKANANPGDHDQDRLVIEARNALVEHEIAAAELRNLEFQKSEAEKTKRAAHHDGLRKALVFQANAGGYLDRASKTLRDITDKMPGPAPKAAPKA